MGLIIRTAGAARTKQEIKRDFEYLLRLWESVRDLTLQSQAPSLVYEEGNLIKRSIRDLYNKDVDEVIVAGGEAHREAKDFMRMLMPSHAKNVTQLSGARTALHALPDRAAAERHVQPVRDAALGRLPRHQPDGSARRHRRELRQGDARVLHRGDGAPHEPRGGRRDRPPAEAARPRRPHRRRLHRHGGEAQQPRRRAPVEGSASLRPRPHPGRPHQPLRPPRDVAPASAHRRARRLDLAVPALPGHRHHPLDRDRSRSRCCAASKTPSWPARARRSSPRRRRRWRSTSSTTSGPSSTTWRRASACRSWSPARDKLAGANFTIEKGAAPAQPQRRIERNVVNMESGFEGEDENGEFEAREQVQAREPSSRGAERRERGRIAANATRGWRTRRPARRRRRRRRGGRGREREEGNGRYADDTRRGNVEEIGGDDEAPATPMSRAASRSATTTITSEEARREARGDEGEGGERTRERGGRSRRRGRRGGRRGRERNGERGGEAQRPERRQRAPASATTSRHSIRKARRRGGEQTRPVTAKRLPTSPTCPPTATKSFPPRKCVVPSEAPKPAQGTCPPQPCAEAEPAAAGTAPAHRLERAAPGTHRRWSAARGLDRGCFRVVRTRAQGLVAAQARRRVTSSPTATNRRPERRSGLSHFCSGSRLEAVAIMTAMAALAAHRPAIAARTAAVLTEVAQHAAGNRLLLLAERGVERLQNLGELLRLGGAARSSCAARSVRRSLRFSMRSGSASLLALLAV